MINAMLMAGRSRSRPKAGRRNSGTDDILLFSRGRILLFQQHFLENVSPRLAGGSAGNLAINKAILCEITIDAARAPPQRGCDKWVTHGLHRQPFQVLSSNG